MQNNATKTEAPSWLLANIAEASKNARKIYLLFIGLLSYIALTIVSTTDRQIILNEPARLPIINVEVPLNGFFILSPFLSIFVFIYFQIYLLKLRRLVSELNEKYPSVSTSQLYPWMFNFADELKSGFIGAVQKLIINFSLWWAMPLVLALNVFWYIKKHSYLTYFLSTLPLTGAIIVLLFWTFYETNHPQLKLKKQWQALWQSRSKRMLLIVSALVWLLVSCVLNPIAFTGKRINFLNKLLYVDLSFQKLITEDREEYQTLYWVDLQNVRLEGANLAGVILKRADLRRAKLNRAFLNDANLEAANLYEAVFKHAFLWNIRLNGAACWGADLQHSNLYRADLTNSIFGGANFSHADLREAILDNTNFAFANLNRANLTDARLSGANFQNASLLQAKFQEHFGISYLLKPQYPMSQTIELASIINKQFASVKSLYNARLDSTTNHLLRQFHPRLFIAPPD
ncbi:MAG TPA: pentapeptide repeat-containing protein [bacterium]|nr:pentapeptide repeat-containing protein [bacterium]